MWRYLSVMPPPRILHVVLEAVLQAKPEQSFCQVDWEILVLNRRKSRGDDLLKLGRKK